MVARNSFKTPSTFLIIDAIGALTSFVLLAFVLPNFISVLGIPKQVLWTLSIPPIFFFVYDIWSLIRFKEKLGIALGTIALLNSLYCITSLVFALVHLEELTIFGWIYIIGEILLILFLVHLEWKTAVQLKMN
jgi:hypothetical protein